MKAFLLALLFVVALCPGITYCQTTGQISSWQNSRWTPYSLTDTTTYTVTFRKLAAADSCYIWRVKKSNLTVIAGEAKREGGTSATVNVLKNGTAMFTNYVTTTGFVSMGSVTGGALAIGDSIFATVRAVAGTPSSIFISLTLTRALK